MTQSQFAELLRVQRRTVLRWEAPGDTHQCAHPSTELLLEIALDDPELARRLEQAGMPNPFALTSLRT